MNASSDTLLCICAADASAVFANQAWLDFTGKDNGTEWVDAIHPEDRRVVVEAYEEAFEEGVPFSAEFRLRRYDGSYRWMVCHGTPRRTHARLNDLVEAVAGFPQPVRRHAANSHVDQSIRLAGEHRLHFEIVLRERDSAVVKGYRG